LSKMVKIIEIVEVVAIVVNGMFQLLYET
jgi:hypothetical protein